MREDWNKLNKLQKGLHIIGTLIACSVIIFTLIII